MITRSQTMSAGEVRDQPDHVDGHVGVDVSDAISLDPVTEPDMFGSDPIMTKCMRSTFWSGLTPVQQLDMYNRAEAERLREHDAEIAQRAAAEAERLRQHDRAEAERVREHEWRMLTERQRADVSVAPVPEIVHVRLPDWTGDTKPETYLEMAEKL